MTGCLCPLLVLRAGGSNFVMPLKAASWPTGDDSNGPSRDSEKCLHN